MYHDIDIPSPRAVASGGGQNPVGKILQRRIWLPKTLYVLLPYLYLGVGIYALGAALLLSHWSWIVPYFLLVGLICLHAGLIIAAMRWRHRQGRLKGKPDGA